MPHLFPTEILLNVRKLVNSLVAFKRPLEIFRQAEETSRTHLLLALFHLLSQRKMPSAMKPLMLHLLEIEGDRL